jgi:Fe-S-cluster containining protein
MCLLTLKLTNQLWDISERLKMKIFLDDNTEVNYDRISENTTVSDVLEAVDIFLKSNPLDCVGCEESCCRKAWSVEVDNICVKALCNGDQKLAAAFVKEKLVMKENFARDFDQYVLNKSKECTYIDAENRCSIYGKRPVICRLYVCCNKSRRYNILREIVASTFLEALVLEDEVNSSKCTADIIEKNKIEEYKRNPAVFAESYDISLEKIFLYAEEAGWLDDDEKQLISANYSANYNRRFIF